MDQILRFFTEWEIQNSLLSEAMLQLMRITGSRSGIMFLWSFIEMKKGN